MDKILPERVYNYCPKCGSKLIKSTKYKTNYCSQCGRKLNIKHRITQNTSQCTICHEFIWQRSTRIIKCSFCGSKYHNSCVYDWLVRHNACPMCQNVFLNPNLIISRNKK